MTKDKNLIFNPTLAKWITKVGHYQKIVLCDAGYPINVGEKNILDLSIIAGLPSFIDVFNVVHQNLAIERLILAKETKTVNPAIFSIIKKTKIKITFLNNHDAFKAFTDQHTLFIRTGEITPYANVIFECGVNFKW